jgi:hypothetical protein
VEVYREAQEQQPDGTFATVYSCRLSGDAQGTLHGQVRAGAAATALLQLPG